MEVIAEELNFSENKIYTGIFNIFELELEAIERYIAFTPSNMGVYSNKIHELHLRVCSEVENLLKNVIHKHFVSSGDCLKFWESHKSSRLENKGLTAKFEDLMSALNSKEKVAVDKLLFGFPDFAFYFSIACEQFNLNKKVVRFRGMVAQGIDWEVIQPFEIAEKRVVPVWWSRYNKLKHNKIENFQLCTLGDLLHSLGGMFILLTYLLKYQTDNSPMQNRNYDIEKLTKAVGTLDPSYWSIESKFFTASSANQAYHISLMLPEIISDQDYYNAKVIDLERISGNIFKNLEDIENMNVSEMNLGSLEYANNVEINNANDKMRSLEHSLFYIYLDMPQVVNNRMEKFRKKGLYARFIN